MLSYILFNSILHSTISLVYNDYKNEIVNLYTFKVVKKLYLNG